MSLICRVFGHNWAQDEPDYYVVQCKRCKFFWEYEEPYPNFYGLIPSIVHKFRLWRISMIGHGNPPF